MKQAWVENGVIRDVAAGAPSTLYHPDVAKFYSASVPDDAKNGDGWDGKALTPHVVDVPAPVDPQPEPEGYTLAFTAGEGALHALFSSMLEAARKA